MTVVFDLDYTLLDTGAFKKALCEALCISLDDFKSHSHQLFSGPPKKHYSLTEHIDFLAGGNPTRKLELESRCHGQVQSRMDRWLFPESIPAVRRFLDAGWQAHLMTLGLPEFQQWKVEGLKSLSPLLSRKIYVGTEKVEYLADYADSDEPVLFVNDNARESVAILKALPELNLALIDGGYCHNTDHNLPLFKLDQIDPKQFSNIGIGQ